MRSLKAQLIGMVSGKSEKPRDSTNLPDSATFRFFLHKMALLFFSLRDDQGPPGGLENEPGLNSQLF